MFDMTDLTFRQGNWEILLLIYIYVSIMGKECLNNTVNNKKE